MNELNTTIEQINCTLQERVAAAEHAREVEELRIALLGKSGSITMLFTALKELSPEDKRHYGPVLNELKNRAEKTLSDAVMQLVVKKAQAAINKERQFDVTASTNKQPQGHLHPYSQFIEELEDIFISMGYEVLDGPELETDFYNFGALNIPADHPARDMYDTFWVDKPDMLLRTHTSTTQIRAMQTRELPIAGIAPGRTYRHEAVDASHDFMFMQCEGFFIDKGVNLSHLFGTAQTFLKTLFKKDSLDIRIRPGFFPFVEPGFEIDMRCQFCTTGCSVCKQTTWMEVFPGGMIHPNVLRAGGIDPEVYSGFAFGFGLSRLVMLKYGIDDIRYLYGGKLKFLDQF